MNREIKFRAWDTKSSRWIESQDLSISANGWPLVWDAERDCFRSRVQTVALQQLTGLKDKNGKEIYEGDVVKVLYTDWPSQSPSDPRPLAEYLDSLTEVYTIVYRAPEFVGVDRFGDVGYLTHGTHGYIEVVGNIHENPELLPR